MTGKIGQKEDRNKQNVTKVKSDKNQAKTDKVTFCVKCTPTDRQRPHPPQKGRAREGSNPPLIFLFYFILVQITSSHYCIVCI